MKHLQHLDGWRAVSILLVLAAHLLPLGPSRFGLNEAAARAGMALFFALSGFLITKNLLDHEGVAAFLVRRLFRIVPLAWLTILVAFPVADVAWQDYLPNLLFYANLPPQHLTPLNAHFWSLGVEVQFYLGVALVFGAFGPRGLFLVPAVCFAVTAHRFTTGAESDIVTWRRVDEILTGSVIALCYAGRLGSALPRLIARSNVYVLLVLFLWTSLPAAGVFNCLRPYMAALIVGSTLYSAPPALGTILRSKPMAYLAAISFALYVFHGVLMSTWLGSGDRWVKYAKRPLLIAITFGMAHLSTFHFERYFIGLGKRLSRKVGPAPERIAA